MASPTQRESHTTPLERDLRKESAIRKENRKGRERYALWSYKGAKP